MLPFIWFIAVSIAFASMAFKGPNQDEKQQKAESAYLSE